MHLQKILHRRFSAGWLFENEVENASEVESDNNYRGADGCHQSRTGPLPRRVVKISAEHLTP